MKEIPNKQDKAKSEKEDSMAADRKQDHIELAFNSRINKDQLDRRFYYEPVLAGHPDNAQLSCDFLGMQMGAPIWISSMTGGTEWAQIINSNLARLCKDFKLGMGLGSCRALLYDQEYFKDFDVRKYIGDSQPLYANLGIAQLEQLIEANAIFKISELIDRLQCNGLIIHINPMQEWLQPEGDKIKHPPIDSIKKLIDNFDSKIIVKEVGQGMGKESLKALFQLPIEAINLAANGGTNFAKLEMLRSSESYRSQFAALANIGHSAEEMVQFCNELKEELGNKLRCKQVIISGGIRNFLDGYYLMEQLSLPCIYGQASAFLKHARGNYEDLYKFTEQEIKGLRLAKAYLRIKKA